MDTINITLDNAIRLKKAKIPPKGLALFQERLTFKNPLYGRKKRFGQSLENVPKDLFGIWEDGDQVTLAKGYLSELVRLLHANRYRPEITDLTPVSERARFIGVIDRKEPRFPERTAREAFHEISKERFGILEGPPGSGRRRLALMLAEKRKSPVLVIVKAKRGLYLWKETAREVMNLPLRAIGLMGDGHKETGRDFTVATNRTLFKTAEGETFQARAGFLIVDQCDQVGMTTIFKTGYINCGYMLGIASGPRRDGLTKLMEAYLGQRLYRITAQVVSGVKVTVRPTAFDYDYQNDWFDMLKALTLDGERNRLIAEDILQTAAQRGKVLFISERLEHLSAIAETVKTMNGPECGIIHANKPSRDHEETIHRYNRGWLKIAGCVFKSVPIIANLQRVDDLFICSPVRYDDYLFKLLLKLADGTLYEYRDRARPLRTSMAQRMKIYRMMGVR